MVVVGSGVAAVAVVAAAAVVVVAGGSNVEVLFALRTAECHTTTILMKFHVVVFFCNVNTTE